MNSFNSYFSVASPIGQYHPLDPLKSCLENLNQQVESAKKSLVWDIDKISTLLEEAFKLGEKNPILIKQTLENIEQGIREQNQPDYQSLLYRLIDQNQEKRAKQLIEMGISTIHSKNNPFNSTPLHQACYLGQLDLVQALIDQGSDINALDHKTYLNDYNGTTPLGKCVEAFLYATPTDNLNPLKLETYTKIFDLLLAYGADPKKGYVLKTPIFNECILLGLENWAWKLIDKANLNATDEILEQPPLHCAIIKGMNQMALKLLEKKVLIHHLYSESLSSPRKITVLHTAVIMNNLEMIKILIASGANANQKAVNPFYGLNLPLYLCLPKPLSAFQLAMDLNRSECIGIMIAHIRAIANNFSPYKAAGSAKTVKAIPTSNPM